MDAHTLLVSNLLFLLLYAAMTLVYRATHRDVQPGVSGCDWFVASHVVLAVSMVLLLLPPALLPRGIADALLVVLVMLGHLLLHRGFAVLVDRSRVLWRAQLGVMAVGLVLLAGGAYLPGRMAALPLRELVWGAQYGLTGLFLLRRGEVGGRLAGWFAGGAISAYALCHALWFGMAVASARLRDHGGGLIPMTVVLLAHGAIAFAFFQLSALQLTLRLEREAGVDELTGLMNRRAIWRAAAKALAHCRRRRGELAVVMIDLDGLKSANDELGHGAGDALLRAVASSLLLAVRSKDTLARIGGDEFCLLLPGADEPEAIRVAERCRSALQAMVVPYRGEELQVSASFGVAHSSDCAVGWEEILRRSDAAMYQAKQAGGGRVAVAGVARPVPLVWMRERGERLRRVG